MDLHMFSGKPRTFRITLLTIPNPRTTEIRVICQPLLSELGSQMDLAVELLGWIY